MLRLGLLINPYAGIGGSVALKGSDGEAVRTLALQRGAKLRAGERTRRAFTVLSTAAPLLKIYCWGGAMGADALQGLGFDVEICGQPSALPSGPQDTAAAAKALAALDLDVRCLPVATAPRAMFATLWVNRWRYWEFPAA